MQYPDYQCDPIDTPLGQSRRFAGNFGERAFASDVTNGSNELRWTEIPRNAWRLREPGGGWIEFATTEDANRAYELIKSIVAAERERCAQIAEMPAAEGYAGKDSPAIDANHTMTKIVSAWVAAKIRSGE